MLSNEVEEITPQELYQKFMNGDNPRLVDVRNPNSFKDWHIFTSENFPFSKVLNIKNKNEFLLYNNDKEQIITV